MMTAPSQRELFEHGNAPQNVPRSVSDRVELHSQSEEAAGECEAGERKDWCHCVRGILSMENYSVIILLLMESVSI